jgi:hypothetical protein
MSFDYLVGLERLGRRVDVTPPYNPQLQQHVLKIERHRSALGFAPAEFPDVDAALDEDPVAPFGLRVAELHEQGRAFDGDGADAG